MSVACPCEGCTGLTLILLRTGSRAAAELQSSTHGVVLVLFCRNYVLSCSVGAMDTTRGVHWCTEAAACCIHVAVQLLLSV